MNGSACGTTFETLHETYSRYHGWLSLGISVLGSVANAFNIAVLTRREMHSPSNSPTNTILTGLAVADLLVLLDYIPYVFYRNLYHRSRQETYTYSWAIFLLFSVNFNQVAHTVSISHHLMLAVLRYIAVTYPQKNREWCNSRRSFIWVCGAYVVCPLICIPLYLSLTIKPQQELLDDDGNSPQSTVTTIGDLLYHNVTLYYVDFSNDAGLTFGFLVYSVVIKIIPCVVLTILTSSLILALLEAKRRRKKLTSVVKCSVADDKTGRSSSTCSEAIATAARKKQQHSILLCGAGNLAKTEKKNQSDRTTDRTSKMLVAILVLFLFTEFPQGFLGLLSVTLGESVFYTCYNKLGDLFDIFSMLNSSINFILYCTMSRQFRKTFSGLFCRGRRGGRWWRLAPWASVPRHGSNDHQSPGCNIPTATTNHTFTQVTQL